MVHFLEYMENSTDDYVAKVEEESINKLHGRVVKLKKERELEDYGAVSEALKEKILAERDVEALKKWNKLAAKVTTIEEFTEKCNSLPFIPKKIPALL